MPYEVTDSDGRCLYRGDDLELACEIHDQVPTAHLRRLPPARPGVRTPPNQAARHREPVAATR